MRILLFLLTNAAVLLLISIIFHFLGLGSVLQQNGVNLNLEILNSRIDHPGYMADTVDWAVAARAAMGSRLRGSTS